MQSIQFDTEEIRRKNPVPEYLAGKRFDLRRAGDHYKVACPFHEEKTPSFAVYDDHAHCYGCDWNGDVIRLEQELTGKAFPAACEALGGVATVARYADPAAEEKRRERARREREEARRKEQAKKARQTIVKNYAWGFDELHEESPIAYAPLGDQWRHLLGTLYAPHVRLWIAPGIEDTGKPEHARHFRRVRDWLREESRPGSRFCPSPFVPGSYSRSNGNLRYNPPPFVVIEADEAIGRKPETEEEKTENRLANLAIIRWAKDKLAWHLRAVIDSGNKSCHGYFEHPGDKHLRKFARYADGLGIDGLITLLAKLGYPASDIPMDALEEELLKYSNAIRLEDDGTIQPQRVTGFAESLVRRADAGAADRAREVDEHRSFLTQVHHRGHVPENAEPRQELIGTSVRTSL